MPTIRRFALSAPAAALLSMAGFALAGCNAWQDRAEFAAPQSRWPASEPSTTMALAPPPPVPAEYCYRTLATADCFSEPKPERVTGYTGIYPNPDSLLAPAPAPAAKN